MSTDNIDMSIDSRTREIIPEAVVPEVSTPLPDVEAPLNTPQKQGNIFFPVVVTIIIIVLFACRQ